MRELAAAAIVRGEELLEDHWEGLNAVLGLLLLVAILTGLMLLVGWPSVEVVDY